MPCEFSLYASADQYSVEYKGRCLQNVGVLCLCASLSYVLWTPSSLVYHSYQFCLLMGEWCWALPGFSLSEPCPLHSFKTVNWKDYGAHLIYVLSFAVLVFLAVITNKYRFRDLKQHLPIFSQFCRSSWCDSAGSLPTVSRLNEGARRVAFLSEALRDNLFPGLFRLLAEFMPKWL